MLPGNVYQPYRRPDAAADTHGLLSQRANCCDLGQEQQRESTSGLDEDEQPVAEGTVKPASLQLLPANSNRVSSQKKQPCFPRQEAMVPGQSMDSVVLL